ncbi:hypothetical protein EJ04DRAFT_428116 [Polyplosphaeria fusca]|uniref:C2H2-type domain-containing protein n=1 Tax=Polyplosphaeria fusca TaxID=682080 RepID=A0A9P4R883_9PLEO|nr:hypothetical protein EJ04DRAFT_428116 [Polyplosphaeria fusca]
MNSKRDYSRSRDPPRQGWCGVCRLGFHDKSALLAHIKEMAGHDNYCNICHRVFVDRNGLKNHVDNTAGHTITCNACLFCFVDYNGLQNHLASKPGPGHSFVCTICMRAFADDEELERHLHLADRHVACLTCKVKFRSQAERDEHWKTTTKHRHCMEPGCLFDAPNEGTLKKHLRDDHYQCTACLVVFPSQSKLLKHLGAALKCPSLGVKVQGLSPEVKLIDVIGFINQTPTYTSASPLVSIEEQHSINCWACNQSYSKYSDMMSHLESGSCVKFPNPVQLTSFIGKHWFSPKYMDIGIHNQIRAETIIIDEVHRWVMDGILQPYICRSAECHHQFGRLSALIVHLEQGPCAWNVYDICLDATGRDFRAQFKIPELQN